VYIRLSIIGSTSAATTATVSYFSGLPYTPAQDAACAATTGDQATNGVGYIWGGSRIYPPTVSATAFEISVTGFYFV
jgi:hypothetical protein